MTAGDQTVYSRYGWSMGLKTRRFTLLLSCHCAGKCKNIDEGQNHQYAMDFSRDHELSPFELDVISIS
jgi:hypothetical protein